MPSRSPALPASLPVGGSSGLDNARDGTCQFHFGTMVSPDGCPICNQQIQAIPIPAPRPQIIGDEPPGGQALPRHGARLPSRQPTTPMVMEPAEDLDGPIELDLRLVPVGLVFPPGSAPFISHDGGPRPNRIEEGDQTNVI